jgi:hypothetical protein
MKEEFTFSIRVLIQRSHGLNTLLLCQLRLWPKRVQELANKTWSPILVGSS